MIALAELALLVFSDVDLLLDGPHEAFIGIDVFTGDRVPVCYAALAAVVRKVRPPEPYKGKGIRYEGEFDRRKAGKAFGSK